jgi:hypothetical protein
MEMVATERHHLFQDLQQPMLEVVAAAVLDQVTAQEDLAAAETAIT